MGAPRLVVTLVGPELLEEEGAEERREMARACEATEGALHVRVQPGLYHETSAVPGERPPHLAVVLCGGVDSSFGSWGRTLCALLREGVPTAFTGDGHADGSTCHDAGIEPLLRRMRAELVCPPQPNPFRFVLFGRASDAFLLGVCGCSGREPPSDADLTEIHREERLASLARLARLHEHDGDTQVARRLLELRERLLAYDVRIPPAATHADLVRWAKGTKPAAW